MKFLPSIQSFFVGLAFLMLVPSVAFADQFALMDRVESGSGFEVTLSAIILEEADGNIVLKNDYHFQLELDDLGVYLFVPTTHLVGDVNNSAIGNLEAGVVGKTTLGGLGLRYRFGLSVPTAAKWSFFEYSLDYYASLYGASADPAFAAGRLWPRRPRARLRAATRAVWRGGAGRRRAARPGRSSADAEYTCYAAEFKIFNTYANLALRGTQTQHRSDRRKPVRPCSCG